MINCVICDDDKSIVEIVHNTLKDVLQEKECPGEISTYSDSRLFVSDIIEYKPIDLAIIDIEMPYYDGVQIAKEIKRKFPEAYIIFLTSHMKYAIRSYELQIFRYALKSEIESTLPRYLREAILLISQQSEYVYNILKNDILERLPYKQMLCIRKDGKYSVINCIDKREIRIRKSLQEVNKELNPNEFILIDRGCIVNIALIIRVADNEVLCKNGERLSISRSKLKETKTRVAKYWGEKI